MGAALEIGYVARAMNSPTTISPVEVLSDRGREGTISSSDDRFKVDFSGSDSPTPEHLFAAAYAACFHSSLLSAAESAHVNIKGSSVSARIDWIDYENGNDGFRVELRAALPGVGAAEGKKLLNQAHGSCPYSRALRHNVPVIVRLD